MPTFGAKSKAQLATCHPDLQRLAERVVQIWDCTVACGHREKAAQDAAVASGASRKPWPTGKHNKLPSDAIDLRPYPPPSGKTATHQHYLFAGIVLATAVAMGIDIRWGGDWDGDHDITDQEFNDLGHFELGNP